MIPVLIVESDAVSVMLLERFLRKSRTDLNVHIAASGEEAIRFLKKAGSRTLVIAEPLLPDMLPAAFLDSLQQNNLFANIALCLLSVLFPHELELLARTWPVSCHFSKPVYSGQVEQLLSCML